MKTIISKLISLICFGFLLIGCSTIDREIIFLQNSLNSEWQLTDSLDEYGRNSLEHTQNKIKVISPEQFLHEYEPEWGGPLLFPFIPLPTDYENKSLLVGVNFKISCLRDSCQFDLSKFIIRLSTDSIIAPNTVTDWSASIENRSKTPSIVSINNGIKNITIWYTGKFFSSEQIIIELSEFKINNTNILFPPLVYSREMSWRYLPLLSISH